MWSRTSPWRGRWARSCPTPPWRCWAPGRSAAPSIRHLSGFGCRLLAYDLYPNPEAAELAEYADLDTIWREADIITLHMPANPEDHHIISADSLSKMKDGVILINTARGDLIDTAALIEAVESRKVGAAALDVLEQESGLYYADLKTVPIPNRDLALLIGLPQRDRHPPHRLLHRGGGGAHGGRLGEGPAGL